MSTDAPEAKTQSVTVIKWLTFLMFMMFAMTTDSVGLIIPQVIKEFNLGMTAAGSFHYASMSGIALAGLFLGFLADKLGRKRTIMLGLTVFAASSFLFVAGQHFGFFVGLLFFSGLAIGIFKTGALALIGDISTSTRSHTATMNMVEGFFGVGAIIGPAIVAQLLAQGSSWKWLYVIAGLLCSGLLITAMFIRYPTRLQPTETVNLRATLALMGNPYALAFSLGAMLYVGVEAAIYVWMPTLLLDYKGPAVVLAVYALAIFFILRAAGRFLGAWLLSRFNWTTVLVLASGAILICFAAASLGGIKVGVYTLPASGLFMSVIYPTLNSKGISCFKKAQHGAASGVILFFTCISAVAAPLAMGAVSDRFGGPADGFALATGFAVILFGALLANAVFDPSAKLLKTLDESDY
jgi:fucose permease